MKVLKMNLLTFLLMLFVLTTSVNAKTLATVADNEMLAKKMMDHFIKKEFKAGINTAKPHWPLPDVELDNLIKNIESQWPVVDKRFGDAVGYELAHQEKIGTSFIRYYFLHKFKNHAIYWRIGFYKPEQHWVVNGVSFRDNLDVLYK